LQHEDIPFVGVSQPREFDQSISLIFSTSLLEDINLCKDYCPRFALKRSKGRQSQSFGKKTV
jgi:hypothetical protein